MGIKLQFFSLLWPYLFLVLIVIWENSNLSWMIDNEKQLLKSLEYFLYYWIFGLPFVQSIIFTLLSSRQIKILDFIINNIKFFICNMLGFVAMLFILSGKKMYVEFTVISLVVYFLCIWLAEIMLSFKNSIFSHLN